MEKTDAKLLSSSLDKHGTDVQLSLPERSTGESALSALCHLYGVREPGWANFPGAVDGIAKADDGGVQALPTSDCLARKGVGCGELFRDNAPQLFERGGEARSYVGQWNGTTCRTMTVQHSKFSVHVVGDRRRVSLHALGGLLLEWMVHS